MAASSRGHFSASSTLVCSISGLATDATISPSAPLAHHREWVMMRQVRKTQSTNPRELYIFESSENATLLHMCIASSFLAKPDFERGNTVVPGST